MRTAMAFVALPAGIVLSVLFWYGLNKLMTALP